MLLAGALKFSLVFFPVLTFACIFYIYDNHKIYIIWIPKCYQEWNTFLGRFTGPAYIRQFYTYVRSYLHTHNYWQFNKILYVFLLQKKEFRFLVQETFNKVHNMNEFDSPFTNVYKVKKLLIRKVIRCTSEDLYYPCYFQFEHRSCFVMATMWDEYKTWIVLWHFQGFSLSHSTVCAATCFNLIKKKDSRILFSCEFMIFSNLNEEFRDEFFYKFNAVTGAFSSFFHP